MNKPLEEFSEIGHCGGQYKVHVKTGTNGRKSVQFGMSNSRPTASSTVGIYSLPQGIPVGMMVLGGIGQSSNEPPYPGCFPVFVSSDVYGKFGHECPKCTGYWRSDGPSAVAPTTCPYCSYRAESHEFLTEGQKTYVEACCELVRHAMETIENGELEINMDDVADAVGKECEKPKFYYAEQSQQNKFSCQACGAFNDILGRFGYCSNCGTHNGMAELNSEIDRIRSAIAPEKYESTVRDGVAAFDAFARQLAKQIAKKIPMTEARQNEWERKLFHKLKPHADSLSTTFDISLFDRISEEDIKFIILMFHRRHVYEHNGGEADEKYIKDSGDDSVRPKQSIRETENSAHKTLNLISKMAKNFSLGFHSIFPPEERPIRLNRKG